MTFVVVTRHSVGAHSKRLPPRSSRFSIPKQNSSLQSRGTSRGILGRYNLDRYYLDSPDDHVDIHDNDTNDNIYAGHCSEHVDSTVLTTRQDDDTTIRYIYSTWRVATLYTDGGMLAYLLPINSDISFQFSHIQKLQTGVVSLGYFQKSLVTSSTS